MSESLSTINIEQLNNAVRSILNASSGGHPASSLVNSSDRLNSKPVEFTSSSHTSCIMSSASCRLTHSVTSVTPVTSLVAPSGPSATPMSFLMPGSTPVIQTTLQPVGQTRLHTISTPLSITVATPGMFTTSHSQPTIIVTSQASRQTVFMPHTPVQNLPPALPLPPTYAPHPMAKTIQAVPINVQALPSGLQALPPGRTQLLPPSGFSTLCNQPHLQQAYIQPNGTQVIVQPAIQQLAPVNVTNVTASVIAKPSAMASQNTNGKPVESVNAGQLRVLPVSGTETPAVDTLSPSSGAVLDGTNAATVTHVAEVPSGGQVADSRLTGLPNQGSGLLDQGTLLELLMSADGRPSVQQSADLCNGAQPEEVPLSEMGCFCLHCMKSQDKPCDLHRSTYTMVADSPVMSKARASLPPLLTLKPSNLLQEDCGVWTKVKLPCNTLFSMLKGKTQKVHSRPFHLHPYLWKLFDAKGFCSHTINCLEENDSNWLRFMKRARSNNEQNVIAYQHGNNIYFITCKEVEEHTELLYWYSPDYAKHLGVASEADESPLCRVCNKTYPNSASLKKHYRHMHPDTSAFKWKCTLCSRPFPSSAKLETHMFIHMGLRPFKCTVCLKAFNNASNLRVHKLTHSDERKFECSICHRKFRQKAHMQFHELTHSGGNRVKCQFCEKTFSRAFDAKQHENIHTKELSFSCPKCPREFFKLATFKKHLLIHDEVKHFPCQECTKLFRTKYHMIRHKKTCKGLRVPQKNAKMDLVRKERSDNVAQTRSARKKEKQGTSCG